MIAATDTAGWVEILAVLTPFLAIALAGVGWLYRHERERRAEVERQLSEHKYRAYVELLNIFFETFKATRGGKPVVAETKLVERMFDANKELMIYGSDDVTLTYQRWIAESSRAVAAGSNAPVRGFAEVVLAIRRDMGNRMTRMSVDDVLRTLITDYDEAKAQGII